LLGPALDAVEWCDGAALKLTPESAIDDVAGVRLLAPLRLDEAALNSTRHRTLAPAATRFVRTKGVGIELAHQPRSLSSW
jgi:hypothetical protein